MGRHQKLKTVLPSTVKPLIPDMLRMRKTCLEITGSLRTGTDDYRALNDLCSALYEALDRFAPEELPCNITGRFQRKPREWPTDT